MQLHVPLGLDDVLARNRARPTTRQQPDALLERMAARFEAPDALLRPWEAATVVVADGITPKAVLAAVLAAAQADEPQLRAWQARAEQPHLQVRRVVAARPLAPGGTAVLTGRRCA